MRGNTRKNKGIYYWICHIFAHLSLQLTILIISGLGRNLTIILLILCLTIFTVFWLFGRANFNTRIIEVIEKYSAGIFIAIVFFVLISIITIAFHHFFLPKCIISGIVIVTGKPVNGINVIALNQSNNNEAHATVTDDNGYFVFHDLNKGIYDIKIYKNISDKIQLTDLVILASEKPRPARNCNFPSYEIKKHKLKIINFEHDSCGLSSQSKNTIYVIAHNLKCHFQNANWGLIIEGHCSLSGSHEYNNKLGKKRAISVKKELIKNGIPESKIQTVSYGKKNPLSLKDNNEANAMNRRVEFILIHKH